MASRLLRVSRDGTAILNLVSSKMKQKQPDLEEMEILKTSRQDGLDGSGGPGDIWRMAPEQVSGSRPSLPSPELCRSVRWLPRGARLQVLSAVIPV